MSLVTDVASNCRLNALSAAGMRLEERDGETWYAIEAVERMAPFLVSLISDRDHWAYILSTGALTAGRVDPDRALFPYYTQDKIADMAGSTGSVTLLRVETGEGTELWEPFAPGVLADEAITRTMLKNEWGNHVVLEEENRRLGLRYRVSWRPSAKYGFVRRVELSNRGSEPLRVQVLDGIRNILPSGLAQRFQNEFSILGDAYKRSESVEPGQLGLYYLSSVPTDLAQPMESLRATVVWRTGLGSSVRLLSSRQVENFLRGEAVVPEVECRGQRGAFLDVFSWTLRPGDSQSTLLCADVHRDALQVEQLRQWLATGETSRVQAVEADCVETSRNLRQMIGAADGLQRTRDRRRTMRHASNTVFNLMRGGALPTGYQLPTDDLRRTTAHFNHQAASELSKLLEAGQPSIGCDDPWDDAHPLASASPDLRRILREYLPLSFGRRHGDPSRPWNRFRIEIEEADGSPRFSYQGNWRDIFQNWEALAYSYPEYTEAMICRFLNATTADGYNPYRLTKDGFEWETIEPGDAWANIGYWGDHQIIYLLRLLETSVRFHPRRLDSLLGDNGFVYAEVPYRIRPYDLILKDPRNTVDYDHAWEQRIAARTASEGADGKLAHDSDGRIHRVNLLEKLLSPLLAKLSNFVPHGGIWMNTQRPEWNDANNALAGYGISVVTLGYIRRYLTFLIEHLGHALKEGEFELSSELARLLEDQLAIFRSPPTADSPKARRKVIDLLGHSASAFRDRLYSNGLSGQRRSIPGRDVLSFLDAVLRHVDASLTANRRPDGLWHAYNILHLEDDGASIGYLYEMLEGQVSILSSGLLGADQVLGLLDALRAGPLYRADQRSYLLYPDRDLPGFLEKNRLTRGEVEAIPGLQDLLRRTDTALLQTLPDGRYAFNGSFHNQSDLKAALLRMEKTRPEIRDTVAACREPLVRLFERSFNHRSFTGRSGTFFAYEGLGSIYWHMVSKLLLAVQEILISLPDDVSAATRDGLHRHYLEIREGLGVHKQPREYGAFTTDAYSHTPAHAGAQQPGMTGQVKEDLLIRLSELGVRISDGCIRFDPSILDPEEFLDQADVLEVTTTDGSREVIRLAPGCLAFTFCQVPVIYHLGSSNDAAVVRLLLDDGSSSILGSMTVPADFSREIFRRSGRVRRVEIFLSQT